MLEAANYAIMVDTPYKEFPFVNAQEKIEIIRHLANVSALAQMHKAHQNELEQRSLNNPAGP